MCDNQGTLWGAAPNSRGMESGGRPEGGAASVAGSVGVGLLESSLVPYCTRGNPVYAGVSDDVCYMEPCSAATRTDGGILGDFIYAVPRHRPVPPPPESRRGYSEILSSKAARTIQAAAEIAYRNHKPFRAMWVFSVNPAHLADFLPAGGYDGEGKPVKTVSGELRRFFSHFADYSARHGVEKMDYAWAAESESSGERDYHPHAHCLVTLAVRAADFAWLCETVERIWGLGSVHMTILRVPRNAATYVLKGVSYSVKGTSGCQGRIWGRRSGVSRPLRHKEVRQPHEESEAASVAVIEVANALRDKGLPRVRTAYGSFSPRGFYPHDGVTVHQVTLAAGIALAELAGGGDEHASLDSPVAF